MAEDRKSGKKDGKGARFGVRPVFLIAGAVALLAFGIIFGASLDLATRPVKQEAAAPQPAPHPSHRYAPPKIEVERSAEPPPAMTRDKGSLFDPSISPEASKPEVPQRAWGGNTETPPMAANAIPAPPSGRQAVVAIVIDDMGLDHTRAMKMIGLNGPLTLSLMTYADGLPGLVAEARKAGHEVMAHLPMEPISAKENPGPGALKVDMDEATLRRTIAADLDGWQGYVGVNNHMGSKFTQDRVRMAILMEELKARGLLWLDSKTIGDSSGPAAAKAAGVPFVERDFFIDNVETVDAILEQLEHLAAAAKSKGSAIAIGHPHETTITALRQWLPGLAARGIVLVPVTEILKRQAGERAPG